jgi:5-methylcytosine-specific restriction endonuclease McrA
VSRGWAGGSTWAWRKIRAAVLIRDHRRCQLRLPGCTTLATEVHHTLGKTMGDDVAHLVAACRPCNLKAGDPRRAARDPRPRPRTQW